MTMEELMKLAEVVRTTKVKFENLSMTNVIKMSPEEKVLLDIQFHKAQKEYNQAVQDYRDALDTFV